MRALLFLFAAITVIGLASCARAPKKPDAIASIRTASVSPSVAVCPRATYIGSVEYLAAGLIQGSSAVPWPALAAFSLTGVLLGVTTRDLSAEPEEIKAYLARENIDVSQIVRDEFIKGLRADPRFESKLVENGDAHFDLEVYAYGLFQKDLFSLQYKPLLGIRAKLIDSSGTVLWRGEYAPRPRDNVALAVPYFAYFEDPAIFRAGFATLARTVTQRFLKGMR